MSKYNPKDYVIVAGTYEGEWESRYVDSLRRNEAQVMVCALLDRITELEDSIADFRDATEKRRQETDKHLHAALRSLGPKRKAPKLNSPLRKNKKSV